MEWILDHATQLLRNTALCDRCLGRQFGNLLTGLTNKQRGFAFKVVLGLHGEWQKKLGTTPDTNQDLLQILTRSGFTYVRDSPMDGTVPPPHATDCELCGGLFSETTLVKIARMAVETGTNVQFGTFLVGSVFPANLLEREDELRTHFNLHFGESMKSELNREVGKRIGEILGDRVAVEFDNPDVVFVIKLQPPTKPSIRLQINPIFLMGRYKKLIRGIPQAKWDCRVCGGAGGDCPHCKGTGKLYETSVAELVFQPLIELFKSSEAKFHGSGREDIDARMLGTGRPFVVEMKEPKTRDVDLAEAEAKVNEYASGKVEVSLTEFVHRDKVREIKTRSSLMTKNYEMLIELGDEIKLSQEKIAEIEEFFANREIKQRTPTRVSHRRADKVRIRRVLNLKLEPERELVDQESVIKQMNVKILCEGGLYVKELMSGDSGRTSPSLAEILGVEVVSLALDVLAVHSNGK
ncbi:MAG: tRNA pseudouridine(54/55) synthase Pus10 [Candidatus Hodarchaeales archaeon]|jgi:tRNA pseudouridine synthase 10